MILPIKILSDVISTTEHKLLISNVITNVDGSFTLYVNYTYYLNSQRSITIDGVDYRIKSFALNESLTVTGSIIPTATEFTITPPFFKHGTPKKVDGEISNQNTKEYPFIWLLEFLDIDYNDRFEDAENITPDLNLFFLTDTYYQDWDIDKHYTEAIHPMLNEIDFFIRTIKKRRDLFGELDSHTVTNHVNFGEYITNKGYDKQILNGQLSGCQLKIELPYVIDVCNTMPVVSICNPVSIYENNVFKEYVQAGGSFYYNTSGGGDAIQTIKDSASNVLYTNVIPSGDNETQIITDSTVTNSDSSYNESILAQGTLILQDVTNIDSDGTSTPTPAQTAFVCTPAVSYPISYVRDNGRYQITEFLTYDIKWYKDNTNVFDYTVEGIKPILDSSDETKLINNNAFGNLDRATNDLGGTVFDGSDGSTIDYLVDHYTGLGWYLNDIYIGSNDWIGNNLMMQTFTYGGFSDWRFPNRIDINQISITDGFTTLLTPYKTFSKFLHYLLNSGSAVSITFWWEGKSYLDPARFTSTNPNTNFTNVSSLAVRNHF
jgi:hypothetical protein